MQASEQCCGAGPPGGCVGATVRHETHGGHVSPSRETCAKDEVARVPMAQPVSDYPPPFRARRHPSGEYSIISAKKPTEK
ncbi:MAG: hypothetical protein IPJ34_28620 [Myxococcales bacterium]|nr:hypothetical protein [Myxococcales bacterium]